jgi:hypothetical protein
MESCRESPIVVARTDAGKVLGRGEFTFLPEKKGKLRRPQPASVSIHTSMNNDENSQRFQNAMQRGADHRAFSGTDSGDTTKSDGNVSTATVYLAYGKPAVQN